MRSIDHGGLNLTQDLKPHKDVSLMHNLGSVNLHEISGRSRWIRQNTGSRAT